MYNTVCSVAEHLWDHMPLDVWPGFGGREAELAPYYRGSALGAIQFLYSKAM